MSMVPLAMRAHLTGECVRQGHEKYDAGLLLLTPRIALRISLENPLRSRFPF